jgi:choline dehydrogenase-like flavoprotein
MNMRQEFDSIIVGAGSVGCVLAARISQDPSVRSALVSVVPNKRSTACRA